MAELLLELFSEEIPARMQAGAAEALHKLVCDGLAKAGFAKVSSKTFVTPRRLTLVLENLPEATPDVSEERRGPRADAPAAALDGFLKANGATLDQCEKRETPKGTFLFLTVHTKGRATAEVLKDVIDAALVALPWPKSMRWGDKPVRWVRPLHAILCLFGGKVVPVSYAGVEAGDFTFGHRFLAPGKITVSGFAEYAASLRKAFVLIDPEERKTLIWTKAQELAKAEGLSVKDDLGLLAEVSGLVEWPVPMIGQIDRESMDLPGEVLSTSMRAHQKYFSTLGADGKLASRFIVVSNMVSTDGGKQIVAGNERVLRARLSDARFFWEHDRKATLASRVEKLKERTFYQGLGSVFDKVERIRALAAALVAYVPGAEAQTVDRAALLAKADLSTGMVGEFPELQGVMGRYYAVHDGEVDAVADAVAEHYSPLGPSDGCPSKPASVVVALADKLDTLAGFWAIGEKPTGSKDPFALRRAALGVIRLILENGLRLPLLAVFAKALAGQSVAGANLAALSSELLDFFADRLKVHLKEQGVRHDLISAVFSLGNEDDLVRLLARVSALTTFVESDEGSNLLAAYRRAMNIVRIEEKKDGKSYAGEKVEASALVQDEETAVAEALHTVGLDAAAALGKEDFAGAMAALARLRGPVDAFFDRVTVNAEDAALRVNRLRLLSEIGAAMGKVADFGKVEG